MKNRRNEESSRPLSQPLWLWQRSWQRYKVVKNAVGFDSGNGSGPYPVKNTVAFTALPTAVVVTAARFVSAYGSRFSERYNLR